MSERDFPYELRRLADELPSDANGEMLYDASYLIEHLRAEVAALTARVERLTPREMTLERAQEILCTHDYLEMDWRLRSDARDGRRRYYLWGLHRAVGISRDMGEREAIYIAQGLERDAEGGK